MPTNVQELFAGPSLPMLDGGVHRARKQQVLAAVFTPEALASYLPAMQAHAEASLAAWAGQGELAGVAAFKALALETIDDNFLGGSRRARPRPRWWRGSTRSPRGSPRCRCRCRAPSLVDAARARATRSSERCERRSRVIARGVSRAPASPGSCRPRARTGRASTTRRRCSILTTSRFRGLHRVRVDGGRAGRARRDTGAEEGARGRGRGGAAGPGREGAPRDAPRLADFVREVKRHTPVLSVSFGKAKRAFELEGFTIPEGWMVLHGLRATNLWERLVRSARGVRPRSLRARRGSDEDAIYVPQGAGPRLGHKCAGPTT